MASAKDANARRLIDGLQLVSHENLPKEFVRFEKDDIYFIQHCHYSDFAKATTFNMSAVASAAQTDLQRDIQFHKDGVDPATAAEEKAKKLKEEKDAQMEEFVPRCLALTPTALFVTDTSAALFRATKYETIRECGYQVVLKKKLFGSEKRLYVNFKSDSEPDCYLYLDAEAAKDMIQTFAKIMSARRPNGFVLREIPESQPIKEYVSSDIPSGFMTAQEIQKLNQNRTDVNEHINNIMQEINSLNTELETLRPEAESSRSILKVMEGATTDDLTTLRRKRQELHETHVGLQRSSVAMQTENDKLQQDVARANEQYMEDKNNYEKLVSESVTNADNAALKEQNNMTILRQKAQKREADKLTEKLNGLTATLAARPPTYTGHEAFAKKAMGLEAKIAENLEKWGREMETANKLEKFIDNMSLEIERVDEQLDIQHQKKMDLIAEIEKRLGVGAAAAKVAGGEEDLDFGSSSDDDGDEFSGGRPRGGAVVNSGSTANTNTTASEGGGSQMAPPRMSVMVNAPMDLDDDLLGESTNGAAAQKPPTPPPAAAVAAETAAEDDDDI